MARRQASQPQSPGARPAAARAARGAGGRAGVNARGGAKATRGGTHGPPGEGKRGADRFAARRATLARTLPEGVDTLLVSNPMDVAYLTGFLGGDSVLLLPRAGGRGGSGGGRRGNAVGAIVSDFRYEEELAALGYGSGGHRSGGGLDVVIRRVPMPEFLRTYLLDPAFGRVGVQGEHMTAGERDGLVAALGAGRIATTSGLVAPLRVVKDEDEVATIRRAARIQEQALLAVLAHLRPGLTELDVAAHLEAEMKARGSTQPGFTTIVAARANGSLPHYRAGKTKLAANQPVLIDWGAVVDGYHSDMTRTFTLGKWPAKVREIYQIVLEAHEAAAAALRPGAVARDIDAIARKIITDAGYGEHFGHGLGHGLGFNGHELPRLTYMAPKDAPEELRPGMVLTIEHGIYLPGVGGVRIEDDYVITERGAKNLCTLPRSLEWSTLA